MIPLLLLLSLLASTQAYEVCDALLVEGCPVELPRTSCLPLQFDANQTAVCPYSLWTAYAHPIFNNFTTTSSFTSAWRKIDGLTCSKGVWRVHRGKSDEIIHLESRVICADKIPTPMIPLDAFRPLKGLSASDKLPNSPAYFCTLDEQKSHDCASPAGYCVAYRNNEQNRSVTSCQCAFGYEGEQCKTQYDPYGYGHIYNDTVAVEEQLMTRKRLAVNATEEMEQDTCNILVAEGCPDEWENNCIKLRYFNGEAYCPRNLWFSGKEHRFVEIITEVYNIPIYRNGIQTNIWEPITKLRCDKKEKRWKMSYNTSDEEITLELNQRVQCSDAPPTSFVYTSSMSSATHYCHRNGGFCRNGVVNGGQCTRENEYKQKSGYVFFSRTICRCNGLYYAKAKTVRRFVGAHCQDPFDPFVHLAPQVEKNETKQAMCDVEELIDACAPTDKYCHRLKANHSRVRCPAKLWLNFGSDLMPDWHEISAVVCVDNDWRSECSKEIEKRPLMCAKEKPSAISTSMWFTLGGAIVAIIFIVGITCIMCLLCRKRRQMKKLVSRANQQTETSCAPSSKCRTDDMSDATVTQRTENSQ